MLEKDLENYLIENPPQGEYMTIKGWIGRQVRVPSGIIDLLGYGDGCVWVIELKLEFCREAIPQVCRYAADIERIVKKRYKPIYKPNIRKAVMALGTIPAGPLWEEAAALDVDLFTLAPSYQIYHLDENEQYTSAKIEEIERLASGLIGCQLRHCISDFDKEAYDNECALMYEQEAEDGE